MSGVQGKRAASAKKLAGTELDAGPYQPRSIREEVKVRSRKSATSPVEIHTSGGKRKFVSGGVVSRRDKQRTDRG